MVKVGGNLGRVNKGFTKLTSVDESKLKSEELSSFTILDGSCCCTTRNNEARKGEDNEERKGVKRNDAMDLPRAGQKLPLAIRYNRAAKMTT